jgi:hypothetical protein
MVKIRLKKGGGIKGEYVGHGLTLHEGQTGEVKPEAAAIMLAAHPDWFEKIEEPAKKQVEPPAKNRAKAKPGRNK